MWKRIYLAAFLVAVLAMVFLTWYSYSWLQSIGSPTASIDGYEYYSSWSWAFLWLSSVLLLLLANILLWKTRAAWAMWLTLGYFIVFLAIRAFGLDPSMAAFAEANYVAANPAAAGPFMALVLFAMALAIVFFNQFIVLRMSEKMYPPIYPVDDLSAPVESEKEARPEM